MPRPRWEAMGEGGVLAIFPEDREPAVLAADIAALADEVRGAPLEGLVDVVPAPASLLVRFDPRRLERARLLEALRRCASRRGPRQSRRRLHRLAVCYGGDAGPDLHEVAGFCGMTEAEVVEAHSSATYTVLATGFQPGFAYLGPLPAALELPRRGTPRPRVPAGSVAIAARQTGVYGMVSAGGWWIIGRTDAWLFDARRDPPARLLQGDAVRFRPVPAP